MFVRSLKKVKVLFSDTYLLNRTILKIVARCKEITLTSYYKDQKLPPSFEEPIGMDERDTFTFSSFDCSIFFRLTC
jgi:hypothetical protein